MQRNCQDNEHIPHKTQKCNGKYSTVRTEIMHIISLYPPKIKI